MIKREPIVLTGTVLGRAVANRPLDRAGNVMQASHDHAVTLTLRFPIPSSHPLEFSMRMDSLPRGWMEIGDPVTVTIESARDIAAKTEPYSIAPVDEATTA